MKTQIVDLTGDCTSCDENASLNVNLKSAKRKRDNPSPKPLESVSDNASAPPQLAKYVPRTKIRKELTQAINGAKVERLRDMLKMLCYENEDVRRIMEREFLVGEDAVIDTRKEEEESKGNGVELADDTEPSSPDEDYWRLKKRKSTRFYQAGNKLESWGSELGSELGIQDREETLGVNYLPERVGIALTDPPHRLPVCENCGETFDPEYNDEKNCVWHSETYKIPNEDAPIWTDHDEDCHGSYESFENNHRYASGFLWGCCEEPITNMGCMRTNHSNPKNG